MQDGHFPERGEFLTVVDYCGIHFRVEGMMERANRIER